MTDEASRQFHTRVLAGSKTVSTELWLRYQPRLVRAMQATFPALAEEEIQDICTDVILNYVERPEQYDPDKRSLIGYLRMAARGDLLNLLDRRKHQPRIIPFDPVAHDRPDRNGEQEAEELARRLQAYLPDGVTVEEFMRDLSTLVPNPGDREVIELMAEGARDTARFAAALGLGHLDLTEQRKRVKQVKDRLRVRLKRHGLHLHE